MTPNKIIIYGVNYEPNIKKILINFSLLFDTFKYFSIVPFKPFPSVSMEDYEGVAERKFDIDLTFSGNYIQDYYSYPPWHSLEITQEDYLHLVLKDNWASISYGSFGIILASFFIAVSLVLNLSKIRHFNKRHNS